RGPRLPLGQAGRPELPRSDLRHPDRGGRRGRSPADLVPPKPGLSTPARGPRHRAGFLLRMGKPEPGIEPGSGFSGANRMGWGLLRSSEDAMAFRRPQGLHGTPKKLTHFGSPTRRLRRSLRAP